ncbi:MAG: hypothetical protein FJX42_02810 [Alphaproteobacteria bacterium]|nr:hypothetical protein [Alphaproteobacteria bacterium]
MSMMNVIEARPLARRETQATPTSAVAALARLLMQEGMEAPRQLFARINGTLARPGAKRISRRVERTATEILYYLFRCHVAGTTPSVSDIYLSTGLARGTAIRCIAQMRDLGVLETGTDTRDRRRSLVQFAGSYQRLIGEFADDHHRRLGEFLATTGFGRGKRATS